ncbi:hypothetical protein PHMEG_00027041 [Phytophthora megakarya]|uniref:M96 mating-specific protein n=1 Tax=Phytophthora megakarya TaxID=4795 RepID=A0A225V848_9STRA|nr:hypothetical protein PHMEG_00027041 [Phytophthora megakarya]
MKSKASGPSNAVPSDSSRRGAKRDPSLVLPGLTKSGKKKRVRRIQIELPILRQQVQELELKLTRLQLQKASKTCQQQDGKKYSCTTEGATSRRLHLQKASKTFQQQDGKKYSSVWNSVAERQLKERLRVEQQQLGLKDSCKQWMQYSTELQELFTKFEECREDMVKRMNGRKQHKFWTFADDDSEIFSDQMLVITKLYLNSRLHQRPCRTMNVGSELAMAKDIPRLEPSVEAGIVFNSHSGVLLPFPLKVVSEAYWKFFRFDQKEVTVVNGLVVDNRYVQSVTYTRSFTARSDHGGVKSEGQGKYMCQKYVSEDGVELMWSGVMDIAEYGGVKFQGMQLHKRGSIRLRPVLREGPGNQSTSTIVETNFETIPLFDDSVTDQVYQVQIFNAVLNSSYNQMSAMFSQMVSELLLKEDWRATFQRDKLES